MLYKLGQSVKVKKVKYFTGEMLPETIGVITKVKSDIYLVRLPNGKNYFYMPEELSSLNIVLR